MALARFTLDLSADRPPVLTVNGREGELPIVGITVRHVPPSLPQLILELAGEVSIEGEGIVALQPEADEVDHLRQFLGNLDPTQLERAALNQFHQGAETNGQAFLAALREMVA